MKTTINLQKVHVRKFFYDYIYPVYAKEFLFMNNYEQFAQLVQSSFILTANQWEQLLEEWEMKETILS